MIQDISKLSLQNPSGLEEKYRRDQNGVSSSSRLLLRVFLVLREGWGICVSTRTV